VDLICWKYVLIVMKFVLLLLMLLLLYRAVVYDEAVSLINKLC
jgi:hypothetical protein